MYCITVVFDVHPGCEGPFGAALALNARQSLDAEPACRVFDVCIDTSGRCFFLYELYDDEAGFRAHLETPHFKAFDAQVASWVSAKSVRAWHRLAA
jgi:quinol monooxygenase YgiN